MASKDVVAQISTLMGAVFAIIIGAYAWREVPESDVGPTLILIGLATLLGAFVKWGR